MRTADQRQGQSGERGFALIIVIWALGIVALLAAGFAKRLHTETLIARNQVALAEAEALANGGVVLVARQLMRLRQVAEPNVATDGAVHVAHVRCRIGDMQLEVRIQDEAGRINLNTASDRLLALLFSGAGADPRTAGRLVDRVVDFRDQDDLLRLNGAERREYKVENAATTPKNAPFESVEELEQVLGVPADLFRSVQPFLTVFQGGSGIDPSLADRRLLSVLDRAAAGVSEDTEPTDGAPTGQTIPPDVLSASPKRVFRITSRAWNSSGAVFIREAVVELIDRPSKPFVLKSWGKESAGGDSEYGEVDRSSRQSEGWGDCSRAAIMSE